MKNSKKINHLRSLAERGIKRKSIKSKAKQVDIKNTPFINREKFVKEYAAEDGYVTEKERAKNAYFDVIIYSFLVLLVHTLFVGIPMEAHSSGILPLAAFNFTSSLAFVIISFSLFKLFLSYTHLKKVELLIASPSILPFMIGVVFLFFSFSEFVRNAVLLVSGYHFSFAGYSQFDVLYETYVNFCHDYSIAILMFVGFIATSGLSDDEEEC